MGYERLKHSIEVVRDNIELPSDVADWLTRLSLEVLAISGAKWPLLSDFR